MMEVRADLFLNNGLDYMSIEEAGRMLIEQASDKGNVFANFFSNTSVSHTGITN